MQGRSSIKASSTKRRVLCCLQRSARVMISSLVRSCPVGLLGLQIKRIFAFSRVSSGSVSPPPAGIFRSCSHYPALHLIFSEGRPQGGRVSPFSATHSTTSRIISVEPFPNNILRSYSESTNLAAASETPDTCCQGIPQVFSYSF